MNKFEELLKLIDVVLDLAFNWTDMHLVENALA